MEAYFTVESISGNSDLTFHMLRTRLVAVVNARIQNGEYTERGLAKILAVSQPQLHNVLKGARTLQWDLADRLLRNLGVTLTDLFTDEEVAASSHRRNIATQSRAPLRHGWDREIPRKQAAYELSIGRMRGTGHATGL